MAEQQPFGDVGLASNPEPRCPCVLLLDVSGSMAEIVGNAGQDLGYTVQQDGTLILDIGDDGIGFDVDAVTMHPGHYGLVGLRERARLIGGHLEVKSAPGMGTTVRFSFSQNGDEGEQYRVEATRQKAMRVIQREV